MYSFGSGVLYGANSSANATPSRFGGLQDVSVDFSFSVKELHGQYQFPIAIARGTGKVECKAKAATLNGALLNNIFFGQTLTTGSSTLTAVEESASVGTSPYTATAANAATFVQDLGVTYASSGIALIKVATTPAAGQYSVAAGVYTFASADTGKAVKLNYTYTSATVGNVITINNQILGTTPLFSAVFTTTFQSKAATFTFNKCTSSKMNFATKLEDFVIPEFDFSVFADDSGTIGTLSFAE